MASVVYAGTPTLVDPKDPQAVLDYEFDWTDWLEGDTIATSQWELPSGITKVSDSNDDTTTMIWLSGGTAGQMYSITNRIVTGAGREQDRTMILPVQNM